MPWPRLDRRVLRSAWILALLALPRCASGDWPTSPGLRLCPSTPLDCAPTANLTPTLLPDGAGAFFVWAAARNIVVQHLDASGNPLWSAPKNGYRSSSLQGGQDAPVVCTACNGSLFIAWEQGLSTNGTDVYVQHMSNDGTLADQDMPVTTSGGNHGRIDITQSWSGGPPGSPDNQAILVWEGEVSSSGNMLVGEAAYAQKVQSKSCADVLPDSVQTMWGVSPATVTSTSDCSQVGSQSSPRVVSDLSGGAIVVWSEPRPNPGGASNAAIYAQRFDAIGQRQWGPCGILVSDLATYSTEPRITGDARGGAFVAWVGRSGVPGGYSYTAYARHLSAGVNPLTSPVFPLASGLPSTSDDAVEIGSDADSAVVVWQHAGSGTGYDLYFQHIYDSGILPRPVMVNGQMRGTSSNPVPICANCNSYQVAPRLAHAGQQTSSCTWVTWGEPPQSSTVANLWLACMNPGFGQLSTPRLVSASGNDREEHPALVVAGDGRTVLAWEDASFGTPGVSGEHPDVSCAVSGARVAWTGVTPGGPNPFVSQVRFSVSLARRGPVLLEIYDVQGRRIRTLARTSLEAGNHAFAWDGTNDSGERTAAGIYLLRAQLEGVTWHEKFARLR